VNETDVLREATMIELSDSRWAGVYGESDKGKCLSAILDDRALREKVKQALSDAMSSRKRNAKDKLLEALGYRHLISRMTHRKTSDEAVEKAEGGGH